MAIINKGMSRRSFLGLTGSVAAVAGLGLTGCGGSSSDEGSASGSTDSANRGGGVITAGSAYAPSSFDPASTGSAVGLGANWHVVAGLYGIDYHDYSTFNELATDDPKSVDDTTFEVTIRKGAKFSDGTEVTADDVVASYTACAASATYAPFFQPFESIEAKDASTVTVKTKVPNFSLLKDRLAIIRVTPATQAEEDRAGPDAQPASAEPAAQFLQAGIDAHAGGIRAEPEVDRDVAERPALEVVADHRLAADIAQAGEGGIQLRAHLRPVGVIGGCR